MPSCTNIETERKRAKSVVAVVDVGPPFYSFRFGTERHPINFEVDEGWEGRGGWLTGTVRRNHSFKGPLDTHTHT